MKQYIFQNEVERFMVDCMKAVKVPENRSIMLGMVSNKMAITTIFGHQHFLHKIQIDILYEKFQRRSILAHS